MKTLKKAIDSASTLSLVCEEDGKETAMGILIDVSNIIVTSHTFALDIREAELFAEKMRIPELTIIPYHALYKSGYGDDRFLIGAADALRFYRGDNVEEVIKKLASFSPQPYQVNPLLKVIDFELSGNQAILYLGEPGIEVYSGDGWDSVPYEFYGEKVEDAYITDAVVLNFTADTIVYQACEYRDACPEFEINGNVSKNELREKKIPCILYSRDGESYGKICFDDEIGKVVKEAGVLVSKLEGLT